MPKYIVYVSTNCAACGTAEVKARSEEEAREKAKDMDYWNFDWQHDLSAAAFDVDEIEYKEG